MTGRRAREEVTRRRCYRPIRTYGPTGHWRRQGGPRPPSQWPGKKELTLCLHLKDDISVTDILKISKITWNYLHFFYKISKNVKDFTVSHASNDPQQLSLAPGFPPAKSGCACYDKPTGRGYFYQMSNLSTCIAVILFMVLFMYNF